MPLILVVILTLPAVLMFGPAGAQASTDPWWGPTDRNAPTTGWAVRIPVIVENDRPYGMTNLVVALDVDFRTLLLEAGWTAQTQGSERRLRDFTLDVDSIRVVEYGRGFAPGPIDRTLEGATPHRFYPAQFKAERALPFDASHNPSGTIMFTMEGHTQANQQRYYYIYANPVEYGKMEPARFSLERTAVLDAYLWGSVGTVHYGYEPAQSNREHRLQVTSVTNQPTTVTFYQYNVGRFQPVPPTAAAPNPVTLDPLGQTSFFIPAERAFKVVSDHPIVLAGHGLMAAAGGQSREAFGNVPSVSGSFAGTQFAAYGFRATATAIKTMPGSVTVTVPGQDAVTLTNANPTGSIDLNVGRWNFISSTGPILIAMDGATSASGGEGLVQQTMPVPAVTGGPLGNEFFASVHPEGGRWQVCTLEPLPLRVVSVPQPTRQVFPDGSVQGTPPARLQQECIQQDVTTAYPKGWLNWYSTLEGVTERDVPASFRLTVGAPERFNANLERGPVGHFAGIGAVNYTTTGPTGIFGHYNDTRVTIAETRTDGKTVTRTISLPADSFFQVAPRDPAAESAQMFHITSTKPISVVSTAPTVIANGNDHAYARYVPGRPAEPVVRVLTPEFRGPLIELSPAEGRRSFETTGPATPVTFQLVVVNHGRWIGGANLPDRIQLSCPEIPPDWTVEACDREIMLDSGSAERILLAVTPPADETETRSILVQARSSSGDLVSTLRLRVSVEVRYGVGMWFDVEGGRKSIDPPIGVNPGETYRYNILIKNTGSTRDRFDLTLERPAEGWSQRLLQSGEATNHVWLDPGASTMVQLAVTAPPTETAPQNLVTLTAQSIQSALAGDIVNTATRIRPEVDVALSIDPPARIAEPNATARFNLTLLNKGNDIFRVGLLQEGSLPEGWVSKLSVSEVDLGPHQPFVFQLLLTPPADARAGDLATVKITAETDTGDGGGALPGDEVTAVVVVRKVHNVTVPPLLESKAFAGETLSYVLPLHNLGNGEEIVEILPGSAAPRWRIVAQSASLTIEHGGEGEFDLAIDVPAGTPAGLYNLTFTTRLSRETFTNLSIPIDVQPTTRVAFEGLEAARLIPGATRDQSIRVVNTGNVAGTFDLATEAPDGWSAIFEPASVTLAPGESRDVRFTLATARAAIDGAHDVTLRASLAEQSAADLHYPVDLARPDLYLEGVQTTSRLRVGDLMIVQASVGNRGAIAADNVTVALAVDGVVVDTVTLGRVPVGEPRLATLSWVATSVTRDVQVIIDPEEAVVEMSRDENVAIVNFGSRLLVPGPGLLGLALAFGAGAFFARRRWQA